MEARLGIVLLALSLALVQHSKAATGPVSAQGSAAAAASLKHPGDQLLNTANQRVLMAQQKIDPCTCTADGLSGGVATYRIGCKKHFEQYGNYDRFCYTVGAMNCLSAQPSQTFPGAGWILCNNSPCKCAADGVSNGVATNRPGCKQHLVKYWNFDAFCYTVGGMDCPDAQPSQTFNGAGWISCNGGPCNCSENGVSNGVATNRPGCKKHLANFGNYKRFCYTVGGLGCNGAQPSQTFQGAGWILC